MLKLPIIEFFLRMLPEGFLFMFASYSFSGHAIVRQRYIISSLLLAISGYLVRLMPINFGVHTILVIIIFILLTVMINKISLIKAITSAIISFILMLMSEMINMIFIQKVLKLDIENIFKQPILKSLFGVPSLVIPITIIGLHYFILYRKNKLI